MAAGYLPEPGKTVSGGTHDGLQIGPCLEPCEHTDCAAVRRDADSECPYCGEAIGYEIGFFDITEDSTDGSRLLAHSRCVYATEGR